MARCARVHRRTAETDVTVVLELDGQGTARIQTGIPFLDHMLGMIARHGFFDLEVTASGDVAVDYHHTVEDVGICLGQAFHQAMGSKEGMRRYASASVPLEETLASAVVDFCDRPYLVYNVAIPAGRIGTFDVELVETFFLGFTSHSRATLHLILHYGRNRHHIAEALFKAFGRAADEATQRDPRLRGLLTTKEAFG
ncbi:MAG: imidazoleglycerol-phosphate dehydratase [Candidatus Tectimicrobiota bacterium]|nr:MAG: imidazoleglycerol-phosphate dehydratase [Candidatus Tectomicrobia bacterium]